MKDEPKFSEEFVEQKDRLIADLTRQLEKQRQYTEDHLLTIEGLRSQLAEAKEANERLSKAVDGFDRNTVRLSSELSSARQEIEKLKSGFPKATNSQIEGGWTFNCDFIHEIQEEVNQYEDGSISMEEVEIILKFLTSYNSLKQ